MNFIHDGNVDNIDACNLLYDILNTYKITKNITSHYDPILHECINTHKGKAKFNHFRILLDIGCSYIILMRRLITKLKNK